MAQASSSSLSTPSTAPVAAGAGAGAVSFSFRDCSAAVSTGAASLGALFAREARFGAGLSAVFAGVGLALDRFAEAGVPVSPFVVVVSALAGVFLRDDEGALVGALVGVSVADASLAVVDRALLLVEAVTPAPPSTGAAGAGDSSTVVGSIIAVGAAGVGGAAVTVVGGAGDAAADALPLTALLRERLLVTLGLPVAVAASLSTYFLGVPRARSRRDKLPPSSPAAILSVPSIAKSSSRSRLLFFVLSVAVFFAEADGVCFLEGVSGVGEAEPTSVFSTSESATGSVEPLTVLVSSSSPGTS